MQYTSSSDVLWQRGGAWEVLAKCIGDFRFLPKASSEYSIFPPDF